MPLFTLNQGSNGLDGTVLYSPWRPVGLKAIGIDCLVFMKSSDSSQELKVISR